MVGQSRYSRSGLPGIRAETAASARPDWELAGRLLGDSYTGL